MVQAIYYTPSLDGSVGRGRERTQADACYAAEAWMASKREQPQPSAPQREIDEQEIYLD